MSEYGGLLCSVSKPRRLPAPSRLRKRFECLLGVLVCFSVEILDPDRIRLFVCLSAWTECAAKVSDTIAGRFSCCCVCVCACVRERVCEDGSAACVALHRGILRGSDVRFIFVPEEQYKGDETRRDEGIEDHSITNGLIT